jgi:hypothetical protein
MPLATDCGHVGPVLRGFGPVRAGERPVSGHIGPATPVRAGERPVSGR